MPDGSDFPVGSNIASLHFSRQAIRLFPSKSTAADRTVFTVTVHDGANTIDLPLSSKN